MFLRSLLFCFFLLGTPAAAQEPPGEEHNETTAGHLPLEFMLGQMSGGDDDRFMRFDWKRAFRTIWCSSTVTSTFGFCIDPIEIGKIPILVAKALRGKNKPQTGAPKAFQPGSVPQQFAARPGSQFAAVTGKPIDLTLNCVGGKNVKLNFVGSGEQALKLMELAKGFCSDTQQIAATAPAQ